MCRLFGLHAGTDVCTATFWLLNAPDSLSEQSRKNPDGTGLGVFDRHGRPQLHKEPIAAWQDSQFATEAHQLTGTTFVAHVRYATTGSLEVRNTHPFLQDGRIFAHNGVVEGLDDIDERLRELGTDDLVLGETDSERVFALITGSIRARRGDETAGLVDAVRWLAANIPIYAVNILLSTATDMWALRYPGAHELYVLDRRYEHQTGAPDGEFDLRTHRIRGQFQVTFAASGRTAEAGASVTLLEAAERQGVRIASSCRAGVCQACRTRLTEGDADCRSSVLDPEDRAAGFILPCVSWATSDCVLEA